MCKFYRYESLFKLSFFEDVPEIYRLSADAVKEHMGLITWRDAPTGQIQKFDVIVAYWKTRLSSIFFAVPDTNNNNRIVFVPHIAQNKCSSPKRYDPFTSASVILHWTPNVW